jgi:hypothetical protein
MIVDRVAVVPLLAHGGVVLVLAGMALVIARVRRALFPPADRSGKRAPRLRAERGGAVPRVLEGRGLASAEAIRSMSAREQEFLLEHASTLLGRGGALRAASARPTPPAGQAVARDAAARERLPVHCPACGAALGPRRGAALLLAPCPRCGRRVSVQYSGGRVVVSVDMGDENSRGG